MSAQTEASPGGETDAAGPRQTRLFWLAGFLGWCALVTLTTSSLFVFGPFPLWFALKLALGFWGFYALAAPAVVWCARRRPLNGDSWKRNLGLHLAGSIVFVLVCEGGFTGTVRLLQPEMRAIQVERAKQAEAGAVPPSGAMGREFETAFLNPSVRLVMFKSQFGLPLYWVLVGVAHSLAAMAALRERERQSAQLAAHLTQAQLTGLRTQLQPHFLFNTLNSIAALIPRSPGPATEMVLNLADLLRMTLREPQRGEIRLGEELKLLRHYVDIQRLRFGERLVFQVEATEDATNARVPPLLLQPLVENAIRHGLETSDRAERITVRARVAEGRLHLEVANTGGASPEESRPPADSTGVGLANTRARLAAHYGGGQELQAGPLAGGGFRVAIRLPARAGGDADAA